MNKVPKAILPIILALALLAGGCQPSSEPPGGTSQTDPVEGTSVGNLASDFQLQNLDGQTISLGELRGKPVLINFWATWCPPCRAEMPYLQQIYEEWSGRGLVLLTINVGESSAQAKRFLQTHDLSLPTLLDTKKIVLRKYNITGIPTTLFIDKNGIIQAKIIGAFPSKKSIERHLNKIVP